MAPISRSRRQPPPRPGKAVPLVRLIRDTYEGKPLLVCDDAGEPVLNPAISGLVTRGIFPHRMDHEALRTACVVLTKAAMVEMRRVVNTPDHRLCWAWIGQLMLVPELGFAAEDASLRQLVVNTVRSMTEPVHSWGLDGWTIASYLAFPLLESVCRKAARDYVDPANGTVLRDVGAKAARFVVKNRLSSLEGLLVLIEDRIASSGLKADLAELGRELQRLADSEHDVFSLIYQWRCSTLHGNVGASTMAGMLFGHAAVIFLDVVHDLWTARQAEFVRLGDAFLRDRRPAPGKLYPPSA